jgi:chromosome segregation ATPase
MSMEPRLISTAAIVAAYPVTAEGVAEALAPLRASSFETPATYREGVKAIATCRALRGQIEERRKELKADSLAFGRGVDEVARQLTGLVEAVEQPMKLAKDEVDRAKEQAKREAAEAERRIVEDRIRAEREAEELAMRAKRQAEEAELVEQRRALEADRKAAAAERAALQAERDAAAMELQEIRQRKAAAEREQAARALAERLAAEAEEQRINALEYEQARKKRLAALAPDREQIKRWAAEIQALAHNAPSCSDESARSLVNAVTDELSERARSLREWTP